MVVPAQVLPNWAAEAHKWLDNHDPDLGPWRVLVAYDPPGGHPLFDKKHMPWLTLDPATGRYPPEASSVLVLTTVGCYFTRVESQGQPSWSRMIVDEAHMTGKPSTRLPKLFHTFPRARKWFLTGTPFEASPDQLAGWIDTLQNDTWSVKKPPRADPPWPRQDEHRRQLHKCTADALRRIGHRHRQLVKGEGDIRSDEAQAHARELSVILKTLYLRRDATESLWWGLPLTALPANYHQEIRIELRRDLARSVAAEMDSVNKAVLAEYHRRLADWQGGRRLTTEPKPSMGTFLTKARRSRILTSFPALLRLPRTKDLTHGAEDIPSIPTTGLYRVTANPHCPYYRNRVAICQPDRCPKIAVLGELIQKWGAREKAVICASSPVSAYIVFLVSLRGPVIGHFPCPSGPGDAPGHAANRSAVSSIYSPGPRRSGSCETAEAESSADSRRLSRTGRCHEGLPG